MMDNDYVIDIRILITREELVMYKFDFKEGLQLREIGIANLYLDRAKKDLLELENSLKPIIMMDGDQDEEPDSTIQP